MEKIKVEVDRDIESLIPDFLEARNADVRNIPNLLKEKNYSEITTLGHGMRGSGGGYGFDGITVIGEAIENAGRAQDDDKILQSIAELKSYLERVEIVFVD